jgi:photosystem II stability/assembly factor-like uncharacterized protein
MAMNIILSLAFLLLFQFSVAVDRTTELAQSSPRPDSVRTTNMAKAPNVIFKSTDDGQTWQDITGSGIVPDEAGKSAYKPSGQFLQRVNGSDMWLPLYPNLDKGGIRIVFEKGSTVFIVCNNALFKSTDNGKIWKQVYTAGSVIKLAESDGLMMAASQNGILRSTDGGENWVCVLNEGGVGIDIQSIKGGFASITYNTESETRRVRASYDGGKSWKPIDTGLPASPSIASIVETGEYLFCGHPDGIFRSSDKGKSWKMILPSKDSKVFNLSVSGNVIYARPKEGGC